MSRQSSFPGFNEKPDNWGLTWNPKGEAPPVGSSGDSLPGSELWKDLAGKNSPGMASLLSSLYKCYMVSARWKVNRAPAIERAKGHCENCRCKCDALEVHHITYERFTRELPGDLLALCKPCHEKADAERRAAWERQFARWRMEAEEAHKEARFEGFLRAKFGDEFSDYASFEDIASAREDYEERYHDRDGDWQ